MRIISSACLYVLSLRALVGRSFPWASTLLAVVVAGFGWLAKHGW
jgi:hypothetical protein